MNAIVSPLHLPVRRHPWLLTLAGALVALQTIVYVGLVSSMASSRRLQDFDLFHADARTAVVAGRNPYETRTRGNLNPPHFLILMAPLAALARPLAFVVD